MHTLYISWEIQNSIINLCGERILRTLVADIRKARYISLVADETSDVERDEPLYICVCYVSVTESGVGEEVREDFVGFVEALDLRGRSLSELVLQTMAKCGLQLNERIGQGYDGAADMSGKIINQLIN